MVDRFRSWRGKTGIFALLLAAVAGGGWVKSELDDVVEHWTFGGQEREQPLAGRICVSCVRGIVEDPGYLPDTQWHISGLYSKAEICYAPLQVVETRPHTIGANNGPIPVFNGPTDAPIFYERFGFCVAREDGQYGEQCLCVLVPHWAVVLPLLLMSAVLLAPARGGRPPSTGAESTLSSRSAATRPGTAPQQLAPRRWKRGLAATCAVAMLISGWVRSSATTDRFRLIFGPSQMIELTSGREGLAFRQSHTDVDEGFRAAYRMLTGEEHQRLTFRPLGWELRDAPPEFNLDSGEMPFGPMQPIAEGDFPTAGGIEQVAFERPVSEPMANHAGANAMTDPMPFNPIRPFEDRALPVEGGIVRAAFEQSVSDPIVNRAWAGLMVDWLGGYFSLSRGPIGLTMVVPYWMVMAAFSLIACLTWRRRVVAEERRHSKDQAAG